MKSGVAAVRDAAQPIRGDLSARRHGESPSRPANKNVNQLVHGSVLSMSKKQEQGKTSLRKGGATSSEADVRAETPRDKSWMWIAFLSVIFSIAALIPYNMLLAADPGSPPFLGFCTFLAYIFLNSPSLPSAILRPSLPFRYHVAFAGLGLMFGIFHASAWMLLPGSLCVLLMNVQMLLAMLLERIFWKTTYSAQQILGAVAVAVGVAMAGCATGAESTEPGAADSTPQDVMQYASGITQMVLALLCLAVGGMLLKVAFERYGEHVQEQIVMQHLLGLPAFFLLGSQWEQIAPRLTTWTSGEKTHLLGLLVLNLLFTVLHQWANVQFTARTPSLAVFNFVDALKKFLGLFLTAMINAPPFPAMGFWCGTLVLILGSLLFASASTPKSATKSD